MIRKCCAARLPLRRALRGFLIAMAFVIPAGIVFPLPPFVVPVLTGAIALGFAGAVARGVFPPMDECQKGHEENQYNSDILYKQAELDALQSQINPHFLYNTLDMINWMAQKDETDNIRDVVQSMSRFYRLTLSKGRDIVTIGDEIRMCEAYMDIQKRRYRGKILYEVEIDEEISPYLIPKITLQPFLENAIVHGINEKEDARGIVLLNGWLEDGRITLSVTDDGTGMRAEDKSKPHTGSHYGMDNIAQRLELFYGEKIPIVVESSPGIGTCIVINIPAKAGGEQEETGYEAMETRI